MLRLLVLPAFLLLAACEPAPQQVNPALEAMQRACDGGDLKACQSVMDYQQQTRANNAAWSASYQNGGGFRPVTYQINAADFRLSPITYSQPARTPFYSASALR